MRHELIPGFEVAMHRSLTVPVLIAGAPRSFAILNGTLSAAVGLGLRLWVAGLVLWLAGHALAVWVTRKDPAFLTVLSRHARHKAALSC
jgi:type IV secretion system protein VirB3